MSLDLYAPGEALLGCLGAFLFLLVYDPLLPQYMRMSLISGVVGIALLLCWWAYDILLIRLAPSNTVLLLDI